MLIISTLLYYNFLYVKNTIQKLTNFYFKTRLYSVVIN